MSSDKIPVKQGSTFAMGCVAEDINGQPLNLTGYTIKCALKYLDKIIGTFEVTPINLVLGQYRLGGLDTAKWPVGNLKADIKYISPGHVTSYTETFVINCIARITP